MQIELASPTPAAFAAAAAQAVEPPPRPQPTSSAGLVISLPRAALPAAGARDEDLRRA